MLLRIHLWSQQTLYYLQGNVILTDGRYEVLTLLRSHRDDARGIATMPRHPYPLNSIRLAQPVTSEVLQAAVSGADDADTLRSELKRAFKTGFSTAVRAASQRRLHTPAA